MKTTLIVSALAATALSKPLLNKKWVVYTTEIDVVTATVTSGSSGWSWGGWMHGSGSTATPTAAPTSSEAPAAPATTPAPAATSWSSTAAAAATTAAASDSYSQAILDQHNNHRANSSAPALTWSDSMASIAAEIASSCVYAHNT